MKLNPCKFACLLTFGSFLSLTWFTVFHHDGRDVVNPDMLAMYKRLLATESRAEQASEELSRVLAKLRNFTRSYNTSANTSSYPSATEGGSQTPPGQHLPPPLLNAYVYLPHLREHPDGLSPNVLLGQGRTGVSLVLGIPTVKRVNQSYLVSTLNSLLYDLSPSERNDMVIIVFVAETDIQYVGSVAVTIEKNFPRDVRSGLLEVVSPSQYFYPNFSSLRESFGDSKDRVKWRTKQNLDYSFLMLYAQDKGTYYVQLEDDIVAKPSYSLTMKAYVKQLTSQDWLFLEFSQLGFIGKMFRTSDLPMLAEFFLMFHKDKPIDWLLDHILWVKVCNPEKDAKDCTQQKARLKQRYKPSLFQHVGLHSSLPGKLQHLKDKDFGKQTQHRAHSNPAAQLSSSLKPYQKHTLERAYQGHDFFWGFTPVAGDYVLISFPQPLIVRGYRFQSGNLVTKADQLYNTTVEVLPSNRSKTDLQVGGQSVSTAADTGFLVIGSFVDGLAEGEVSAALQPISAMRLVVQCDSDVWILLSEIFIKL